MAERQRQNEGRFQRALRVGEGGARVWSGSSPGDAVLIARARERAKVSRGWLVRRVALATFVVPHPSGLSVARRPENHPQTPTVVLSLALWPLFALPLALYIFYMCVYTYVYVRIVVSLSLFISKPRDPYTPNGTNACVHASAQAPFSAIRLSFRLLSSTHAPVLLEIIRTAASTSLR